MAQAERRIETLPIDQIPEAPRNAKAHDEARIAASLGRFGYIEPMVLDERTGRLVAGHGRLAELRARHARGEQAPDGITIRADKMWMAPVVRGWRSRSDEEADAAAIALNRVGEAGGWNRDVLAEVLAELQQGDADLAEATGFTAGQLDDLMAELGDVVVLPDQGTDAEHAPLLARGEAAPPREVQGLREVGLMFSLEHHREYLELLARLRRVWAVDAAPLVVLQALRTCADAERRELAHAQANRVGE